MINSDPNVFREEHVLDNCMDVLENRRTADAATL